MKIPPGMTFHGLGWRLFEGDDIPEDLLAQLPSDHPLKAGAVSPAAPTSRPAPRPTPAKD